VLVDLESLYKYNEGLKVWVLRDRKVFLRDEDIEVLRNLGISRDTPTLSDSSAPMGGCNGRPDATRV
jgi:hypothetical protein